MTSEAAVQANIRLQAAKDGLILWRNNSGALPDTNGRVVRFGLGNDSSAVNKNYKSSDLIGIRPVIVTPNMVDTVLGQFVSIEVKPPGWRRDNRTAAQEAWIRQVMHWGGVGGFASSVAQAQEIWK